MVRLGVLAVVVFLVAGAVPAFSSSSAFHPSVRTGVKLQRDTQVPGLAAPSHAANRVVSLREPWRNYPEKKAAAELGYQRWLSKHPKLAQAAKANAPRTSVSGTLNQPGISDDTAGTPPDTTGAAGPSNYVEMVNSSIAVYSNTDLTSPTSTTTEETFTGDSSPCDGNIQWDQEGQRWLYSILGDCFSDEPNNVLYFGWSKTTAPTLSASNWCQYSIPTGQDLQDYPKLGHDDSQILIGVNDFQGDGNFNSHVYVFDKPAPGVSTCPSSTTEGGDAAVIQTAGLDENFNLVGGYTPVPANIADSSATGYVAAIDADQAHLDLYAIGRNAGANALLSSTSVTVPAFCFPAPVPQPGTTDTLDDLDTRLTQAVAVTDPNTGQEGIWTQHAVAQGCSNGSSSGPSVERWYELSPGASTPTQIGTVSGPNGAFAFMGAISPSNDGQNTAIFYNSGSSSQLADFRVSDRHLDTTSGQMIEDLQLASSPYADEDFSCDPNPQDGIPCRWGDYNGASPDPSNSSLVWGTGELTTVAPNILSEDGAWGTQNAAIDVTPAANYELDVTATDVRAGSGTVTDGGANINCPGTCSHSYPYGTPVTLTATPAAHSVVTWSGDCTGTQATCDLPMGGPQAATATFSPQQESLDYTKSGNGSGGVSSSPSGLSCNSTCSPTFDYGTPVQLTASPSAGSVFTGWSGDCSGTGTCDVTMNQLHSVTATFTLMSETLTVSKAGAGSGTVASTVAGISCGSTCSHSWNYGTSVTLTATPATGSTFTGWSGACSGTANCTVSLNGAKSVTATFALIPETLTVTKQGTGSGSVTSTPAGINCGTTCSDSFGYGTSVTLTATPGTHVTFDGWSGACSGTGNCTVPMTAASSVSATFTKLVCDVPKLKGKSLSAAKTALKDANCGVGKVTKKTSKTVKKGHVISSSPSSGAEKAYGTDVKLVVSSGKPPKKK